MRKVIFLDFDGVICVDWDNYVDEFGHEFRKEYVNNLEYIIKQTSADIVVSSSWRTAGLGAMKLMWEIRSMPGKIIGITDRLNTPRGEEIAEYLRENPCDKYVIIDDDSDFLPEQKPFFVKTSFNKDHEDSHKGMGLTKKCAEMAIAILNEKSN